MNEENVIIEIENAILNGVIINENIKLDSDSIKNTAREIIRIVKNSRNLKVVGIIGHTPDSETSGLMEHRLSDVVVVGHIDHGVEYNPNILLKHQNVNIDHVPELNLNSITITKKNRICTVKKILPKSTS